MKGRSSKRTSDHEIEFIEVYKVNEYLVFFVTLNACKKFLELSSVKTFLFRIIHTMGINQSILIRISI